MRKPLTTLARTLRASPTDAEARLWRHLRNRQLDDAKFRRQAPSGRHIPDFVCDAARLIVELDGGQHTPETDAPRTRLLEANGYTVIRFWNDEVLHNTEGVIEEIRRMLSIARGQ
jgi:very-short-patch-repair endonuclease